MALPGEEPRQGPTTAVGEARLKGVNFHGTLGALERTFGEDVRRRVVARIPGEAGEALRNGAIVTGGWYAAGWYDALLVAIEAELPNERDVVHGLAYAAVQNDFRTLFRLVSLVATPSWAMEGTTRILTRYVQGGRAKVVRAEEGLYHARFDDFHGYTRRMWIDFVAGIEGVLDLMKVVRRPTELVSGGVDGPRLEIVIRYARG